MHFFAQFPASFFEKWGVTGCEILSVDYRQTIVFQYLAVILLYNNIAILHPMHPIYLRQMGCGSICFCTLFWGEIYIQIPLSFGQICAQTDSCALPGGAKLRWGLGDCKKMFSVGMRRWFMGCGVNA